MRERLQRLFAGRPLYMNALMVFCAYMSAIYLPFDLLVKPVEQDQEVWFGVVLTGWAAKATAPAHWAIYLAGTWGFAQMRAWMHPWAAVYTLQVALSMFVWSWFDPRGAGPLWGLVAAAPFVALALALWRHRERFGVGARAA